MAPTARHAATLAAASKNAMVRAAEAVTRVAPYPQPSTLGFEPQPHIVHRDAGSQGGGSREAGSSLEP